MASNRISGHCISHFYELRGKIKPVQSRMSLLNIMVKFGVSACLAYSAKGIDLGQTLVQMLMSRYFVDVINFYNQLTLNKVDYPQQCSGRHSIN